MKPITFDVQYYEGVQGKQDSRIVLNEGGDMVLKLKALLYNPTVRGVQVTIEKTHSGEF